MTSSTKSEQTSMAEASHIKFNGMSTSAITKPPELGDVQTFVVRAKCIGDGRVERKDGEIRHLRTMEVMEVEAGEITRPERDPELPYDDASDDD